MAALPTPRRRPACDIINLPGRGDVHNRAFQQRDCLLPVEFHTEHPPVERPPQHPSRAGHPPVVDLEQADMRPRRRHSLRVAAGLAVEHTHRAVRQSSPEMALNQRAPPAAGLGVRCHRGGRRNQPHGKAAHSRQPACHDLGVPSGGEPGERRS